MKNYFTYQNKKIVYSSVGKGTAILLLHGFLENSSMWNDFIPKLSLNNRIITIDLPGHGESDCLNEVHSMENMADIIMALLENLSIDKLTLIGHSMGGYVALAFAEKFPKNTSGLMLVNATAQEDNKQRKENRLRANKIAKTNYEALLSMSISNMFTHKTSILFAEEIENCKNEALKTPIQGYIASSRGMMLRKNREEVLKSAPFKKLYVIGKNDSLLDYNSIKNEAIRTDTPYIIFSGGHMSTIENKIELQELLINFIEI